MRAIASSLSPASRLTVWSVAAFGVTVKLLNRLKHPLWSTGLYVAMGWVAVVAAAPLVARMPGAGLAWLVCGGLLYTAGAVVFMFDSRVRFAHFAWHLFVLGVLRGGWGWSLFGVVWAMAALGMAAKLLNRLKHPLWSTGLYVAMGWVAVIAAAPLLARMPGAGLAWLIAGGVSYTAGAVVFLYDSRVRYAHFVWHLFVLGGSACHFVAVLRYAQ